MCIHCKKAGVIDAVATTFDGVKAIRQAVADYKRHISTTSKKALKENKDYGDDTGAKKAEKSIAVMNDVSEKFIATLAQDSWTAKTELRNLFRKSPNWNEELQAIILKGTCTPEPNYNNIERWIQQILYPLAEKGEHDKRRDALTASKFFTEKDYRNKYIDALNKVAPKAYREGKKITRVFKAFCDAIGITDETKGSKFQELFAKITDELLAKEYEFQLYISINPAHFLTMSNPKYDERGDTMISCHSFNSTEYTYNCGCSGYARDKYTFIAFTAKNSETLNDRKTSRQIFAYKPNNGLLLQSRMYTTKSGEDYGGVDEDTAEGKAYLELIQREISELEKASPIWETCKYTHNKFDVDIKAGKGFGGYPDWLKISYCANISIRFDCKDNFTAFGGTDNEFEIGTYGLCIKCGKKISSGLYCDACAGRCGHCGRTLEGEGHEVYERDGNRTAVCDSCFNEYYSLCPNCGEYHYHYNFTYTGEDLAVCRNCLENNFVRCQDCGRYYLKEHVQEITDIHGEKIIACDNCCSSGHCERRVSCDYCGSRFPVAELIAAPDGNRCCQDCFEDRYRRCDHCGEIHSLYDMTRAVNCNGEIIYLCEHCAESSKYETCEECGRLAPAGTLIEVSDHSCVCEDCLDNHYTQCEICGEYEYNGNLNEAEDSNGDTIYICDNCRDENYITCDHCERLIHADDANYISDDIAVCEDCLCNHYSYCAECDNYYPNDEVYTAINADGEEIGICETCAENHTCENQEGETV